MDSDYQGEASDCEGSTPSPQLDSQMAPLKKEGPPANDPDQRDAMKPLGCSARAANIECLHLFTSLSVVRQAHLVCLESAVRPRGAGLIIGGKQIGAALPPVEMLRLRRTEGSRGRIFLTRLKQSNCSTGSFSPVLVALWGSASEWPNSSKRKCVCVCVYTHSNVLLSFRM